MACSESIGHRAKVKQGKGTQVFAWVKRGDKERTFKEICDGKAGINYGTLHHYNSWEDSGVLFCVNTGIKGF